VGLGLIFLGIFLAQPVIDAPAIRIMSDVSAPPIFPMLFVTIACGAISGFHGLVSSGTTAKQVNKLADSRLIGYGAMLGEGTLAVATTIAAVAGFNELVDDIGCNSPINGDLTHWAKEGVLLINSVLTVIEAKANSHKNIGWEIFTDSVIQKLSQEYNNLVFVLWGNPSQKNLLLLMSKNILF
jgi:carbon starvation protein CstA